MKKIYEIILIFCLLTCNATFALTRQDHINRFMDFENYVRSFKNQDEAAKHVLSVDPGTLACGTKNNFIYVYNQFLKYGRIDRIFMNSKNCTIIPYHTIARLISYEKGSNIVLVHYLDAQSLNAHKLNPNNTIEIHQTYMSLNQLSTMKEYQDSLAH